MVFEGDGGYISFATYLNFYLLAAEQCLLLSALAAFLAKGSFRLSIVSAFFGYTVEGGSIAVGKASTDAVVSSSVLILFSDLILTQLLS